MQRCLRARASPIDRSEGYIGVLVDDLVTRGVSEPYRMFTSRAEYRLSLRSDNADDRLTPKGLAIGLVGGEREQLFHVKHTRWEELRSWAATTTLTSNAAQEKGFNVKQDGRHRSVLDLLSLPATDFDDLAAVFPRLGDSSADERAKLEADATYSGFLDRQQADIAELRRSETIAIPDDFDFAALTALSNEVRERLIAAKPRTLAQATRIEGITPASLSLLVVHLKRQAHVA